MLLWKIEEGSSHANHLCFLQTPRYSHILLSTSSSELQIWSGIYAVPYFIFRGVSALDDTLPTRGPPSNRDGRTSPSSFYSCTLELAQDPLSSLVRTKQKYANTELNT